ncbi:hypothetical protein HPB52_006937 [Rhipicephalus sanguineus]|uniref:THAP-type domain-containing protein n=1 Tax=Rhipicephalus sanguineus TaxID=34632 RepID=A0A9D4T8R7_RHISA|nr:hypothetical protein HPB52_006937 [Rhipicephalus sanguineus]
MVCCAVVGCKSRTFTKAEKEKARQNNQELSNFRFFKIPKVCVHECGKTKQLSERRQREWIARLNRKGVSEDPQKYGVADTFHQQRAALLPPWLRPLLLSLQRLVRHPRRQLVLSLQQPALHLTLQNVHLVHQRRK